MTQTTGAGTPRGSFLAEVKDAVTSRATVLVTGTVVLALLFIASYVGALHDPKPKNVPRGVVAPEVAAQQTVARLENLPGDPLNPRVLPGVATARDEILNREIDGALVIDPAVITDTLLGPMNQAIATGAPYPVQVRRGSVVCGGRGRTEAGEDDDLSMESQEQGFFCPAG